MKEIKTETFLVWYLDTINWVYGLTVCRSSLTWNDLIEQEEIKYYLFTSRTDKTHISSVLQTIVSICGEYEYDFVIFEKMNDPKNFIYNLPDHIRERLDMISISAELPSLFMRYGMMLNYQFFYVDEPLFSLSDLVFDDVSTPNLIDPVLSDNQVDFPLTRSLLIACDYFHKMLCSF